MRRHLHPTPAPDQSRSTTQQADSSALGSRSYDKAHLTRRPRNIRQAMQQQIAYYCAVQRDERGLEKVVEDAKYRMSRYGVKVCAFA